MSCSEKVGFQLFSNSAGSATAHRSPDSVFHVEGPEYKNTFSDFVCSHGSVKSGEYVEWRPEGVQPAPTGSMMFIRYSGHVPQKTECMKQHIFELDTLSYW